MRLIKMFGLAALAAVAAMAFVGASTASATFNTQLCNTHTALTCSSAATSVGMLLETGTVGKLLNSLATVLCLQVHGTGTPLALATPQLIHILELSFLNCGTNTNHTNCEVKITTDAEEKEQLPLALLLKTGLDEGTLTFDNGLNGTSSALVFCENVFLGVDVHCIYDMAGTSFAVGAQKLVSNKVAVQELNELSLCPNESTLDGTLVTTANRYVLQ